MIAAMCGRFSEPDAEEYQGYIRALKVRYGPEAPYQRRWNVCPTQPVRTIEGTGDERRETIARWGFAPAWSKRPLINAQAESAGHKATFRAAVRDGRCIVPAASFYEWQRSGTTRQPLRFAVPGRPVVGLAGLLADFPIDGVQTRCLTILTTNANRVVAPIHARMPVILEPVQEELWLGGELSPADLAPLPDDQLEAHPANPAVNDARNEGPELWAADDPPPPTTD